MAIAYYYDDKGHYPPAYVADEQGRPMHSWRVLILPYLGYDELYRQYDFSESWDGPKNRQLALKMPRVFAFSQDDRPGNTTTNYLAVVGPETVWPGSATITPEAIADGLANTILIVENRGAGVPWMEPRDLSLAELDFVVNSPGGISGPYVEPAVAMVDTSLNRLQRNIRRETLRALLTAKGGENVARGDSGGWQWLPDGRDRDLGEP
jgi:hypothetical protein